ncbi:MAG: 50S ribosomal protein L18 [Armatimonadota bacterium]
MSVEIDRHKARIRRKLRGRRKIFGTADRPRLCVTKTLKHIYAQVVDDERAHTLAAASTLDPEVRQALKGGTGNRGAASEVGKAVAARALEKGVHRVVFDRSGWPYHGRVKALAEGAREAGLEF